MFWSFDKINFLLIILSLLLAALQAFYPILAPPTSLIISEPNVLLNDPNQPGHKNLDLLVISWEVSIRKYLLSVAIFLYDLTGTF
jgi:hypothetical protein